MSTDQPTDHQGAAGSEPEHFVGCHPADTHAPEKPEGHTPQETEACWHCGTPTTRGCDCFECWSNADYVPPSAAYHCRTCGRWWAYMTGINVTTITWTGEKNELPASRTGKETTTP